MYSYALIEFYTEKVVCELMLNNDFKQCYTNVM